MAKRAALLPARIWDATAERGGRPLLILFALGVLLGAVAGTYLPWLDFLAVAEPQETVLSAFWNVGWAFLALALTATTYLGVALIPAETLLGGFLLARPVAALYAGSGWAGLLHALISIGVPALILAPCFLIAALDAAAASRRLLERRFDLPPVSPGRRGGGKRAVLIAVLAAAGALCSFYLPALLTV